MCWTKNKKTLKNVKYVTKLKKTYKTPHWPAYCIAVITRSIMAFNTM